MTLPQSWQDYADASTDATETANDEALARITERQRASVAAYQAKVDAAFVASQALATPNPLDTLPVDQLRETLRANIVEHDLASAAVGTAEANIARAAMRSAAADVELQSFAELDETLLNFRLEQIKHDRSEPLPFELLQAQARRQVVVDEVDIAHKAHDRLCRELKLAQEQLAEAVNRRTQTAKVIIMRYADNVATRAAEALNTYKASCRLLLSIGDTPTYSNGTIIQSMLSQKALDVLGATIEPLNSTASDRAAVSDWLQRLCHDANAEPPVWTTRLRPNERGASGDRPHRALPAASRST